MAWRFGLEESPRRRLGRLSTSPSSAAVLTTAELPGTPPGAVGRFIFARKVISPLDLQFVEQVDPRRLRYLEHFKFRLVREALIEREVLWRIAPPHIVWPLRFVLPLDTDLRPAWVLRIGLFLYDHLGGRHLLPPIRTLRLTDNPAGEPLKPQYARAFEYSDLLGGRRATCGPERARRGRQGRRHRAPHPLYKRAP